MKKQLTIFLVVIFIFGLIPVNFSFAITQNQINAEVQIACPFEDNGEWMTSSGSGTIIDSKGIILTNRHVVADKSGGIIKTCAIGFIESINKEPNFGTVGNYNLAEVKYYTTSDDDVDTAILYLDNLANKTYPYVNIWSSNSDTLQFGEKIEVIGFPSIGGSTITYTSGDFSGSGSTLDGMKNYIKTTAPLEHGNSGGAAYNQSGQFIGIPTMVVAGTLNSISYILSVNSIKNWLSGILGNNYKQEVIKQNPIIETPLVSIKNDITPPNFNILKYLCYKIPFKYTNMDVKGIGGRCFSPKLGQVEEFNHLQFSLQKGDLKSIDSSGIKKIYYYFDKTIHNKIDDGAEQYIPQDQNVNEISITKWIDIKTPGKYYFSFFGEDNNGNISNAYIYEYVYEQKIDKVFIDKLKGYILIQVESHGEAYYVNPNNEKRYFLGRPADAFQIMRELGLGASHDFVVKYKNVTHPDNVIGKILIDVGDHGKAYYIYPKNKRAYYLGRPDDAFRVMRELGLGISNDDLEKIEIR